MKNTLTRIKTLLAAIFSSFLFFACQLPLLNRVFAAPTDGIFGNISAPPGVEKYNTASGGIGIVLFFSNIIRLATVVAGVWTMINFITAGWTYLTSEGDPSASEKVSKKLINSVIGLVIIALSYTLAGIVGLLIFGDAGFFIDPGSSIQTINDI